MNARIITQVLVVTAMLLNFTAKAQCDEWIWPENEKAIAEEKNVLYADQVKNEQYKKASINHRWLLQKAPNLHSAIYINGEKIFKELADAEKDAAQKKIYVDSLMLIYDMRIENCGQEAYVLNRKAF
ncbi:MAG: hypothetical protein OEY34_04770, partial [Cyclobacteriaceae bacterium]|nr:hypothetical protein [Cyclobacteriaceae bacterium]